MCIQPRTGNEGPEGKQRYNSTLSLTSALDEVGFQHQTPAALPPGKKHAAHCKEGWMGPRSLWTGAENLAPPPGFDPRTVQPVASRYTDWAIPAHWLIPRDT
jgi:hypothetical protein